MNLNGIVNRTLGLGNPLGQNMLMEHCEPDIFSVPGSRKLMIDYTSSAPHGAPEFSGTPAVVYNDVLKTVSYYPKTVKFYLKTEGFPQGMTASFYNNGNSKIVSVSQDGQEVEVGIMDFFNSCNGGWISGAFVPCFKIHNPVGCFNIYMNDNGAYLEYYQSSDTYNSPEGEQSGYYVALNWSRTITLRYKPTKC